MSDRLTVSIIILIDGMALYPDEKLAMCIPVLWLLNKEEQGENRKNNGSGDYYWAINSQKAVCTFIVTGTKNRHHLSNLFLKLIRGLKIDHIECYI